MPSLSVRPHHEHSSLCWASGAMVRPAVFSAVAGFSSAGILSNDFSDFFGVLLFLDHAAELFDGEGLDAAQSFILPTFWIIFEVEVPALPEEYRNQLSI